MEYLDRKGITYEKVDVRGDQEKMEELKGLSGQTKTPTLKWDGEILANFGVDELQRFLEQRESQTGPAS
jgi:glutaredoxin